MTESALKQFSLPVQLVKSQISVQKALKRDGFDAVVPCLDTLKAKYDWIREPVSGPGMQSTATGDVPMRKKPAQPPRYELETSESEEQNPQIAEKTMEKQTQPLKKETAPEPKPKESQLAKVTPDYGADAEALIAPDGTVLKAEPMSACPHCGRRFGATAMARHEPKCLKNPERAAAGGK